MRGWPPSRRGTQYLGWFCGVLSRFLLADSARTPRAMADCTHTHTVAACAASASTCIIRSACPSTSISHHGASSRVFLPVALTICLSCPPTPRNDPTCCDERCRHHVKCLGVFRLVTGATRSCICSSCALRLATSISCPSLTLLCARALATSQYSICLLR